AIRLHREPATGVAAELVELYWAVSWELPPGEVRTQETLPYPSIHLVIEDGVALVYGIPDARFSRELQGSGSVLGIKFRPGGFRPLLNAPVSGLRNRVVPASEVLACDPKPLIAAVLAADDPADRASAAEAWLIRRLPASDPQVDEAAKAVAAIETDPAMTRVEEVARLLATSTRSLQRLFTDYVGASPKWVVRRFRMHEAAGRAAQGPVDWASLARDLGYYDQSHFVRDFTRAVGMPPLRYAAECVTPEQQPQP
ncbi:MAG: transcriptional activator FtrA, partial [Mycobacterium sp.]|nr:transcriptional activator FtrA [Mycobacterium sp.]